MPLSPEDQEAIAVHVKSYQHERIDATVARQLRWIHALGVASIAALIGLFLLIPDMAADRVFGRVEKLADLAEKVGNASRRAEETMVVADRAAKNASEAESLSNTARQVADAAGPAVDSLRKIVEDDKALRSVQDLLKKPEPQWLPELLARLDSIEKFPVTGWQAYPAKCSWATIPANHIKANWRLIGENIEILASVQIPRTFDVSFDNEANRKTRFKLTIPDFAMPDLGKLAGATHVLGGASISVPTARNYAAIAVLAQDGEQWRVEVRRSTQWIHTGSRDAGDSSSSYERVNQIMDDPFVPFDLGGGAQNLPKPDAIPTGAPVGSLITVEIRATFPLTMNSIAKATSITKERAQ